MNPMPTIAELIRVRDLATADDPSSWPAGFMQSITEQAQKGRSLSASQLHHYEKIAVNYTPEALAEAATWSSGATSTGTGPAGAPRTVRASRNGGHTA